MNMPLEIHAKTRKRTLTRRAVMWLGQTCNLRCKFCYFLDRVEDAHHPEHAFMSLDKAKQICHNLRYVYGNTAIDIQGGEPTIFPGILDLIRYCREIGLHPTLITNGLVLADIKKLQNFKEAGVRDFLVSMHGIGEYHDEVVGRKGAYEKLIKAVENMNELGIPFRINCTMSKPVVPLLPQIAGLAIKYNARVVNYISFNLFGDQEVVRDPKELVASYTEIVPSLIEAMDILEEAGIECNVRYVPFCMVPAKYRKNFTNFQQISYDHHEWDHGSALYTNMLAQRTKDNEPATPYLLGRGARRIFLTDPNLLREREAKHPLFMKMFYATHNTLARVGQKLYGEDYWRRREARARIGIDLGYAHAHDCRNCSLIGICDGFQHSYMELHGLDEAKAVKDIPLVDDPCYYMREQEKVVEPEDAKWAL